MILPESDASEPEKISLNAKDKEMMMKGGVVQNQLEPVLQAPGCSA